MGRGAEPLVKRSVPSHRIPGSPSRAAPYAADWIVKRGCRAVAADFDFDAGRAQIGQGLVSVADIPIEASLLRAGDILIKNLTQLSKLSDRRFHLAAMPLNLPRTESAPARVLRMDWPAQR